jgi:hypothetical protein
VLYINREDIQKQSPSEEQKEIEADRIYADIPRNNPLEAILCETKARDSDMSISVKNRSDGTSKFVSHIEIEFLYRAYEGEYWWWEVVETIRRLLLTAVISIVTSGDSACCFSTFILIFTL